MKTAVEWLVDELLKKGLIVNSVNAGYYLAECWDKAIQMEKEQIVNAHYQGYRTSIGTTETSEQYYNETFKQEQ